jgi:hypothetical protein
MVPFEIRDDPSHEDKGPALRIVCVVFTVCAFITTVFRFWVRKGRRALGKCFVGTRTQTVLTSRRMGRLHYHGGDGLYGCRVCVNHPSCQARQGKARKVLDKGPGGIHQYALVSNPSACHICETYADFVQRS